MNGNIYQKRYLKELGKFIKLIGNRKDIIFWLDMACHYSKDFKFTLESSNISYVKEENMPNCPQIR